MDPVTQDSVQTESFSFFSGAADWLAEQTAGLNFFILLPLFVAVAALMIGYFRRYQRPAQQIRDEIRGIVERIREVRLQHASAPDAMSRELDNIFNDSRFRAQWAEYCASLHVIQTRGMGVTERAVLATQPSEMFFPKESIVDLSINADFYRHLPGILTGIGIIGTFSGLVWGLHQFKPDTSEALASLPLLLQEVTSAFIGSGIAILAAIFVTYQEKSILSQCYVAVDELNREIDSLYARGVEEEYLARLVKVTEGTPDAFMANLSKVLERNNRDLAHQITVSIRDALEEPMTRLSGAINMVTKDQEEAVGSILERLLGAFLTKVEDTFGQQIVGINDSFRKSTAAMDRVEEAMSILVNDMAQMGTNSVDRMSGTLADSMLMAASAQEEMNRQMRVFMDELRELLVQQQQQSSEIMDVTMRAVLTRLQAAITQLAADRSQQIENDRRRYNELTEAVAGLVQSVDTASGKTSQNLAALQNTVTGAITGMNNGAVIMRLAADRFTTAGNTLSVALEKGESLADSLSQLKTLVDSVAQFRRAG